MLQCAPTFRELDRLAQQLMSPGTWSRPATMAMDAYREGDEYVVAFDLPASAPSRSTSMSNATC